MIEAPAGVRGNTISRDEARSKQRWLVIWYRRLGRGDESVEM